MHDYDYLLSKTSLAGAGIFRENKVNTMAADALAPCVARSSVAMALNT